MLHMEAWQLFVCFTSRAKNTKTNLWVITGRCFQVSQCSWKLSGSTKWVFFCSASLLEPVYLWKSLKNHFFSLTDNQSKNILCTEAFFASRHITIYCPLMVGRFILLLIHHEHLRLQLIKLQLLNVNAWIDESTLRRISMRDTSARSIHKSFKYWKFGSCAVPKTLIFVDLTFCYIIVLLCCTFWFLRITSTHHHTIKNKWFTMGYINHFIFITVQISRTIRFPLPFT